MFASRARIIFQAAALILLSDVTSVHLVAQTTGDVDQEFAALKVQFTADADSSFGTDASSWRITGAYLTKRFLKDSLSTRIKNSGIAVSVSIPPTSFSAPYTEVTTEAIDPIPCNADRGCNSDCDLWDVGCHLAKLDCERLKAM